MFVYTLGDIFGICLFLLFVVVSIIWGLFTAMKQSRCNHDWVFHDPSYGNKWWGCRKCRKKHDGLEKPTKKGDNQ